MTSFVQIIEFKTSRVDEIRALVEEVRASAMGTALRGTVTADRERPGYYLNIVEFESYESAMANSARPDVSAFASKMAALCEEPPTFYNLDVIETFNAEATSASTKAAVVGAATAVAGAAAATVAKARQKVLETRAGGSHQPGGLTAAAGTSPTVMPEDSGTSRSDDDTTPGATPRSSAP